MTRHLLFIAAITATLSCSPTQTQHTAPLPSASQPSVPDVPAASLKDWGGVYASPDEIGGFAGTVLVLETDLNDGKLHYRMRSYTDVVNVGDIKQDEEFGSCLVDGNALYLPEAHGYMSDDKPHLIAFIERYTRVEINGRKTLMRDDALRTFRNENKLYDYGILIKVAD